MFRAWDQFIPSESDTSLLRAGYESDTSRIQLQPRYSDRSNVDEVGIKLHEVLHSSIFLIEIGVNRVKRQGRGRE